MNKVENICMELHDSKIEAVRISGPVTTVVFGNAYLHKLAGSPGVDPGTGWSQRAELEIRRSSIKGMIPNRAIFIADGTLQLETSTIPNMIPVPLHYDGQVRLTLVLSDSSDLVISGIGADLRLLGEPQFVESVPGGPDRAR